MNHRSKAEDFRDSREPPLRIGDVVRLNSGSPRWLIVDTDGENVTVAWYDEEGEVQEESIPEPCVHRIHPLEETIL